MWVWACVRTVGRGGMAPLGSGRAGGRDCGFGHGARWHCWAETSAAVGTARSATGLQRTDSWYHHAARQKSIFTIFTSHLPKVSLREHDVQYGVLLWDLCSHHPQNSPEVDSQSVGYLKKVLCMEMVRPRQTGRALGPASMSFAGCNGSRKCVLRRTVRGSLQYWKTARSWPSLGSN